mmetsp:Transcript_67407/g.213350  ORF Transcript_67407/g.213350 Transcript_67407/m.213350 type:complete len:279 (+) Transcript_67407:636-1472(+)
MHVDNNEKGSDRRKAMDLMFRSAQQFHKSICCVVLTDDRTDLSEFQYINVARTIQVPKHVQNVTGHARGYAVAESDSKLIGLLAYMKMHHMHLSHIVFIDTDTLVISKLDPLFNLNFATAITLTGREHVGKEVNAGVWFFNARFLNSGMAFVSRTIQSWNKLAVDDRLSLGDQRAMYHALQKETGLKNAGARVNQCVQTASKFTILLLTTQEYNGVPRKCRPETKIVHFKGNRKAGVFTVYLSLVKRGTLGALKHVCKVCGKLKTVPIFTASKFKGCI